jgi:hypothetical protein
MREPEFENESAAVITAFMRELAREPIGGSPPTAAFIWWKAQLARRWDAERRAAVPVKLHECICAGLAALGGMSLVAWRWTTSGLTAPPSAAGIASIAGVVILLTGLTFAVGDVISSVCLKRKGLP